MNEFARLHHQAVPLLLPNAWDHASAMLLAEAGFRAVGTTSLGVAAAAGHRDSAGTTKAETIAITRALGEGRAGGSKHFLLSVDAEDGYSDDPAEVAAFAEELAAAGASGINLEDARPGGTLADPATHARKIAAVKKAGPELFVNARTDTHWLNIEPESTVARLKAYQDAGADGVFVPGLVAPGQIAAVVKAIALPLNVLYRPGGPSVTELGDEGVKRVSLGSLLYRVALGAALDAATAIREGRPAGEGAPPYAAIQALSDH